MPECVPLLKRALRGSIEGREKREKRAKGEERKENCGWFDQTFTLFRFFFYLFLILNMTESFNKFVKFLTL